jgi:GxxExxY protein
VGETDQASHTEIRTLPVHQAQLLTYLKLARCRIGLLINFNTISLTDGIKRCVL